MTAGSWHRLRGPVWRDITAAGVFLRSAAAVPPACRRPRPSETRDTPVEKAVHPRQPRDRQGQCPLTVIFENPTDDGYSDLSRTEQRGRALPRGVYPARPEPSARYAIGIRSFGTQKKMSEDRRDTLNAVRPRECGFFIYDRHASLEKPRVPRSSAECVRVNNAPVCVPETAHRPRTKFYPRNPCVPGKRPAARGRLF